MSEPYPTAIDQLTNTVPPLPYCEGLECDENMRQIVDCNGGHIATVEVSPSYETVHYMIHAANTLPSVLSVLRDIMHQRERGGLTFDDVLPKLQRLLLKLEHVPFECVSD